VPAYNEERALPSTLAELVGVVDDLDVDLNVDIVVVDDGSRDATAEVARASGVVTLQLPFNTGVGGAVRTGLRFAEQQRYARAVVIDADGQHDPRSIPALLARLDAGADLVIGSRFLERDSAYHAGWLRRAAMRFLAALVRHITGQRFSDVTSGCRAFSTAAIHVLAREYPSEYLADTVEVLLIADCAGLTLDEVAVNMRPRTGGVSSSRRLASTFNYLRLLVEIASGGYRRSRVARMEPS
jgi:glycosyltransferase involved in cell wall biosynthesis